MLFDFDFNDDGELDAFECAAAYHCYEETTSEESDDWDCDEDSYTFDWDFDWFCGASFDHILFLPRRI